MLVIVTNREDLTADWLVLELAAHGVPFLRLSSEDYPERIGIELDTRRATLYLGDTELAADQVTSVWWRRPVAPVISVGRDQSERAWAIGEALTAWDGFWSAVNAHWVNLPANNVRADCKPLQLQEAQNVGFQIPPTLITNRTPSAAAFHSRHGTIVSKPLRSGLISPSRQLFTAILEPEVWSRIDTIGPEPYLLQAYVQKAWDVRVTVMGDQVFGCRIDSQSGPPQTRVDWRHPAADDLRHEPVDLDEGTTGRILGLTREFGLRFAAIDLAELDDGSYVFFEINPNGQWAWVEQLTGQPLRAALVAELHKSP